jgi:lysophospholipase L1-like esterase
MRPALPLLFAATLFTVALPAAPQVDARARTVLAATPISRMDLPWWKQRFGEKQRELRQGGVDLVFYGDSITQDWERHGPPPWFNFQPVWQRFYRGRHAVNLGFTGDTTASLLWRVENGEAAGIAPKAAVILIGANNMGRPHWSAADTVAGIGEILDQLRRRLPHTRLLLLSVLPSERSAWITATTDEINRMLAVRYGEGEMKDVRYLDVAPLFLRNGHLDRNLFLDPKLTPPQPPLHPDPEGQERMAAAMEPTLAAMLGEPDRLRR